PPRRPLAGGRSRRRESHTARRRRRRRHPTRPSVGPPPPNDSLTRRAGSVSTNASTTSRPPRPAQLRVGPARRPDPPPCSPFSTAAPAPLACRTLSLDQDRLAGTDDPIDHHSRPVPPRLQCRRENGGRELAAKECKPPQRDGCAGSRLVALALEHEQGV